MKSDTSKATPRRHARFLLCALLASLMTFGSLSLVGCGGSKEAAQEQDNCYGDDMPVINE